MVPAVAVWIVVGTFVAAELALFQYMQHRVAQHEASLRAKKRG